MTTRSAFSLLLAWPLVLAACGGSSTPVDGGTTGTDAGTAELPPATATAVTSAGFALGLAAALTGPLLPQAESLRDDGGRLDGPAREARAHTDVEAGVSGMSVVEPPTCATYVWAGMSVTATFAGCTLETTGESIDGSIGIAVGFFPTMLTLTFTDLVVGTTHVDGMLTVNVGGQCGGADLGCTLCGDADAMCHELRANQSTVTGNLTVTSSGMTVLAIDSLSLDVDATGVSVTGDFTIDAVSFSAAAVHWNTGDCLPTSGTATASSPAATITFLPTTPADGIVQVTVGAFPPFSQMLFMACPP